MSVELVVDARAQLGEAPMWDDWTQNLWWIDIDQRYLHAYSPRDDRDDIHALECEATAVAKRGSGGLILATSRGFETFDPSTREQETIALIEADDPSTRSNDGKCDSFGRFYAGTMDRALTPARGALYRLDPDGSVSTLVSQASIPNGLAWSSDGRTLYWIDSPTRAVDAFDVDPETGDVSNRRTVFHIAEPGLPDGMCIDDDGFLWIAMYGGAAVRRYSIDGAIDRIVELPVTQVTSCAFGGRDLGDLYITTAADGLDDMRLSTQRTAGGLFVCRPGVPGCPSFAFAA